MKSTHRRAIALALVAILPAGCAGHRDAVARAARGAQDLPSIAEVRAIAEEGFVYGLPIVMNYTVMYSFALDPASKDYKGPFNTIANDARVFTWEDTTVVTPNSDTPYSMLWLDLRAEPMVISVPAVEKRRYYSVMLNDGNTFNYGYVGSRATGNAAGDYLVVGPEWQGDTPRGVRRVFRSSTDFSLAIFRTQLFDAKDMPNVTRIQAGYRVRPLSTYLQRPAPPAPAPIDFPRIDDALAKRNFFAYLDFALRFAPAGPEERAIRAALASIGVGPGKTFDFSELPPAHQAEIALGMQEGEKKVEAKAAALGAKINGWHVGSAFGDRAFYQGDWLLRAAAAKAGIYGNDAAEAMYPMTREDADGRPLDGSRHTYELTFPAGEEPPVHAFWSITIYDGRTQLLVKNPIGRYLVNSPMLPSMRRNTDGSLTIFIQKDSPGAAKEANWLPAPDGPIYLVLRLYWPKEVAPSILPPGAGTWQPPAVRRTS